MGGLQDGETFVIDTSSAMQPGLNTITIETTGKHGSAATVVIADT